MNLSFQMELVILMELSFFNKTNKTLRNICHTYFFSEFSDLNNDMIPSVWDSRNLSSFTGGYKLNRNWEVSMDTDILEEHRMHQLIKFKVDFLSKNCIGLFSNWTTIFRRFQSS